MVKPAAGGNIEPELKSLNRKNLGCFTYFQVFFYDAFPSYDMVYIPCI